jgi:hypothetical protein
VRFLTHYGRRPMHLLGGWAILVAGLAVVAAVLGLFWSPRLSGLTILAVLLGILVPLVLFLHGLQAELAASARSDEPFCIVERVGPP